jgi:hypothetical protein
MLSVEQVKKLLNNPRLSDKEVEVIRDDLYGLAQIIFEKLKEDKKRKCMEIAK